MTGGELEVYEAPAITLFRSDEPSEVVANASAIATELANVVNKQQLYANVQGKKHVLVEGWTLLGTIVGVFPVLDGDPVEVEVAGVRGWRATVKAVTRDGSVVGRASALCLRSEANWKNRDEYALMSMAQTRATSKALRQPLGFVMSLAGFSATPAEEMPRGGIPMSLAGFSATPAEEMPRGGIPEVIEEAEIIRDPEGKVFPDQRDLAPDVPFEPGVYQAPEGPRGGSGPMATEAQRKMLFRLRKKLVGEMAQPESAILGEIAKHTVDGSEDDRQLPKVAASELITKLKRLAGEDEQK